MQPNIRHHLLWEYSYPSFNFQKGARIVVERVVERGNLADWRALVAYYGKEKVLELVSLSKQLTKRDKAFAAIFIHSEFLSYDLQHT